MLWAVPLVAVLALGQVPTSTTTSMGEAKSDPTLAVVLTSAGMSALVLGIGTQAWWDGGLQSFSLRETGFFGKDTYAGGSDKLGHMFASYAFVHSAAGVYEAIGVDRVKAAWISAGFVFLLFNGFELIDGFTEFGFEYGDVIFNTLGIATGLVTRLYPSVDQIFGMRLGYVPSHDFLANEKSVLKFLNDYTGMLFYFDLKAKGIFEALGREPGFEKHLIGGLVYTTQGYSPVRYEEEDKRRMLGMHLGLSLAELLRTNADGDKGMRAIARFFDFYAMPFFSVSIMNDLNHGDWYLSFGLGNRAQVAF